MNVSIVIPVYNEAERLRACLEAISKQTVMPLEVIVVDNNSNDTSVSIAESFSFVTLLMEPRQGVVHARNRGFNNAKGEIIGRIDADTILPSDWVKKVQTIFIDIKVSAVSGAANYYDFALEPMADNIDSIIRQKLSNSLGNENFLWGANMALRRSSWVSVKSELCNVGDIHEDFDLAIHLQQKGFQVDYRASLSAGVSSRRIDTGFIKYIKYTLVNPKTYAIHGLSGKRNMYPVLLFCWLIYFPARVIYRSYDYETESFKLKKLLAPTQPRIDPTSNIA